MSYYAHRQFSRRTFMFLAAVVFIVWVCMLSGCQIAPAKDFCQVTPPILVKCYKAPDGKQTCRKIDPACSFDPKGDGAIICPPNKETDYLTPQTEAAILAFNKTHDQLCK